MSLLVEPELEFSRVQLHLRPVGAIDLAVKCSRSDPRRVIVAVDIKRERRAPAGNQQMMHRAPPVKIKNDIRDEQILVTPVEDSGCHVDCYDHMDLVRAGRRTKEGKRCTFKIDQCRVDNAAKKRVAHFKAPAPVFQLVFPCAIITGCDFPNRRWRWPQRINYGWWRITSFVAVFLDTSVTNDDCCQPTQQNIVSTLNAHNYPVQLGNRNAGAFAL